MAENGNSPGTPGSRKLYNRAVRNMPGGISRNTVYRKPYPYYVKKASGCYVTDVDGNKYIDFANNMASLIHGHAHPAIVKAVRNQLKKGTAFTLATEAELNLATLLVERIPSFGKIRFVNSGTEAVMAAIKAARAFTGRQKIAKAEGAYHGSYDYAEVSQASNPSNWGDPTRPQSIAQVAGTPENVLKDVVVFPFNNTEHTLKILDEHAGDLACVLIDPVPHRIGLLPARKEYIEALAAWTIKNKSLLVFDEVITFRVSYGGAQEGYPCVPDITALGKIIGGGFPIGAIAGRTDIMSIMDPGGNNFIFPLSGTFSANPVSAAAGLAAMTLFDRNAVDSVNKLTMRAIRQLNDAIKLVDVPVSITGSGSMFRIHFSKNPPSSYREAWQDKELAAISVKLLDYLLDTEKLILVNTCSCMLSTVTAGKEIDRLSDGFLRGLRYIKADLESYYKNK